MPRLANGQRFIILKNGGKISSGNDANSLRYFLYTPLFSKNSRFNQEKTVQFIRRLIIWEKTGLGESVFQINRQPGTDMTRKKVSEIRGLKKTGFH